jgi:hypothetical protein
MKLADAWANQLKILYFLLSYRKTQRLKNEYIGMLRVALYWRKAESLYFKRTWNEDVCERNVKEEILDNVRKKK